MSSVLHFWTAPPLALLVVCGILESRRADLFSSLHGVLGVRDSDPGSWREARCVLNFVYVTCGMCDMRMRHVAI